MSEENKNNEETLPSFEEFAAMIDQSLQQPQRGTVVQGMVVQINGEEVIVNFGYKTEGSAPRNEFSEDLKVGDTVELAVVSFPTGGYVKLSKKSIDEKSDWANLQLASSNEEPVKVKIIAKVDKGYVGKIGEVEAFIPDNHIDINLKNIDPNSYIGKTLDAKILKFGNKKRSALVSPRLHLIELKDKGKKVFFESIKVGDKIKGVVKTLKDYGAFISFGSVDGFLHKNEIAHGRVKSPTKYLAENDTVEVVILEINLEELKISVGMKQLQLDPWELVPSRYPLGEAAKGAVITRKRVGYVIEVEPGIDGFVPNEEISWLKNSRTTLNPKDVVEGRVIDYDNERKRIVMSVKDLAENPWKEFKKTQPEGSVIKGVIKNITDFGLFIDLGYFIDGLIRKSDISWTKEPENLNDIYKVGDTVEAKILTVDEDRERISLGIKQLEANPWKEITKLLPTGKVVDAPILNVTKQGLEVQLPLELKGFIPLADFDPAKPGLDQFKVGDNVTAAVVKVDSRDKSIILSIKKYLYESERKETREYMKKLADTEDSSSFGSIFKDKFAKKD